MQRFAAILLLICLFLPVATVAQEQGASTFRATELPIPRFASLRADKVFARTGPALRYPVHWVYKRDGLPVEIVREYDTWRKIRDPDGEEGWVHQSLLAGRRTAVITSSEPVVMRREPEKKARMVARLEPDVVATLKECVANWCLLEVQGFSGWVERNSIWGIYPQEELN